LSDADLKLNDKLKQEEIDELNLAGSDGGGEDGAMESMVDKIANMVVEKLSVKAGLINEIQENCDKPDKDIKKKKKTIKIKDKDADEAVKKEEE
jgi:hypothetical protein